MKVLKYILLVKITAHRNIHLITLRQSIFFKSTILKLEILDNRNINFNLILISSQRFLIAELYRYLCYGCLEYTFFVFHNRINGALTKADTNSLLADDMIEIIPLYENATRRGLSPNLTHANLDLNSNLNTM